MKQHLLLGTAGHIDHGKTTLVKALTGVDTDRLPEEKRRRITIDLGFAPLELGDYALGIVDVPGHERFIKNMLAGATGIDLALLVVAADDSVKPQTREHLEILEYLDLKAGVIAITKCDLAEPDWIDLVESEIRELVAGTQLESATIVRVSAPSGKGLEELRLALGDAAKLAARSSKVATEGPFRMSIDRVFTISGHGTVVTGSVTSGQVGEGEQLQLQPQGVDVRVRGLQSHDRAVKQVGRGQRAAVNLGGIHYQDVARGQCLASCGALRPSRIITVSLQASRQISRAVKHRTQVRLHVGTSETLGTLSLLGTKVLEPGNECFAQVFLSEEVATVWGQPFVVRAISPHQTLGGGRILNVSATRIKRINTFIHEQLAKLGSNEPLQRAAAYAYFAGTRAWHPDNLYVLAGVESGPAIVAQLTQANELKQLSLDKGKIGWLHMEVFQELCQRIENCLRIEHLQTPLHANVERSRLNKYFGGVDSELLDACLVVLEQENRVLVGPRGLALPDWNPELSQRERHLLEQIVLAYRQAEYQPPGIAQLAEELGEREETLAGLIHLATEQDSLVRITRDLFVHADSEQEARRLLAEKMHGGQKLSVSEIREFLGTSRKFAVPFCEYLDTVGFTRREGNLRTLIPCKSDPVI
ncbi:MAG: selenocysteine-specific translation elongation factor [Planctomycetales bacterium]|nr:selenocysteine-specific translation elongation factor [Planctomycetales bacterium]